MNSARRKKLTAIQEKLEELSELLGELRDEEQEAFDNLPEALQGTERGQAMENAVYYLDAAFDNLEDAYTLIESAKE